MTTTIILGSYTNKNGEHPIRIDICNGKTRTSISIGAYCSSDDFDGRNDAVKNTARNARRINQLADAYITRLKTAAAELAVVGRLDEMTATEFRDYALGKKKVEQKKTEPQERRFVDVYEEYVDGKIESAKTKDTYRYAYDKMREFCDIRAIRFTDINVSWLNRFDIAMKRSCMSDNSRGIVMRNIRSVYNYAIACQYTSAHYPFGRHAFLIKKGCPAKQVVPLTILKKIIDYKAVPGSMREQARDAFLFSMYAGGINPIDMYNNLRYGDGDLVYCREKIRRSNPYSIHLKMTCSMREIAERYKPENKKMVLGFSSRIKTYSSWYAKVRQELKRLGAAIGYPELHFYMARYSFSSYAASKACKIDRTTIDMLLGHIPQDVTSEFYIVYDWENAYEAQDIFEQFIKRSI